MAGFPTGLAKLVTHFAIFVQCGHLRHMERADAVRLMCQYFPFTPPASVMATFRAAVTSRRAQGAADAAATTAPPAAPRAELSADDLADNGMTGARTSRWQGWMGCQGAQMSSTPLRCYRWFTIPAVPPLGGREHIRLSVASVTVSVTPPPTDTTNGITLLGAWRRIFSFSADSPFCPKDTEQVKRLCQITERCGRQRRNLPHTRNAAERQRI